MVTPAASESMWPASASRAREPERAAPTTWTTTTARVMDSTAMSRWRWRPVAVIPWVWLWSCPMPTRLVPAELVQALVIYAEVVGDLVDYRHSHFLDHFLARHADVQDGLAEDGDPVRQ
jgi:hypothetical protein